MKAAPRSRTARATLLAVALALAGPLCAQVVVPLDQQDMANAEKLYEGGKYAEALKLYQGIPQKYPTSALIPGSNLGEAICYFFLKDRSVMSALLNRPKLNAIFILCLVPSLPSHGQRQSG